MDYETLKRRKMTLKIDVRGIGCEDGRRKDLA
jgi:hypothetical protein